MAPPLHRLALADAREGQDRLNGNGAVCSTNPVCYSTDEGGATRLTHFGEINVATMLWHSVSMMGTIGLHRLAKEQSEFENLVSLDQFHKFC